MSSTTSPTGKKIVLNTLLETDHYSSLIKELTCTKCLKYMKPPIHLCVDGHSICGPCFEKSYQCHVCKKEFATIRPMVLESLANKVLFPCTNGGCPKHATLPVLEKHSPHCQFRIINCFMARVYGQRMLSCIYPDCHKEDTMSELEKHIPYCEFKTRKCVIGKIDGDCKWEGRAGDWMDHCFVEHKTRVTELPFITVKDKWDAKRTEPVLNYFLMKCFDKVFNVYQIYDKRGGRMMWTVLVNDEQAEKFYFEVDLFLPNLPSKRIVYRRPCKCEKDADFLEHTQNVYIPVENVFSMLDDTESMNFTIRIGTCGELPAPEIKASTTSINTVVERMEEVHEKLDHLPKNPKNTLDKLTIGGFIPRTNSRAKELWKSARNSWPRKMAPAFDGMVVMMYPNKRRSLYIQEVK